MYMENLAIQKLLCYFNCIPGTLNINIPRMLANVSGIHTPFNSYNNPYEKGIACSKFLRYKKLFTRKIFTPYDLQKSLEMIMQFNCPPIPSK